MSGTGLWRPSRTDGEDAIIQWLESVGNLRNRDS